LLWVDAAVASLDLKEALGLMAVAANAMWQSGFVAGWESSGEMLRDEAKSAGRKGGTARHKSTRELKLWAQAEALSMQGADIDIARRLSRRIPPQLESASADPERLIYETLRGAAASRRTDRAD
jgi:hypothetical protein